MGNYFVDYRANTIYDLANNEAKIKFFAKEK